MTGKRENGGEGGEGARGNGEQYEFEPFRSVTQWFTTTNVYSKKKKKKKRP